jgi:hypothetical protein
MENEASLQIPKERKFAGEMLREKLSTFLQ